ncbi:MAG: hypothetical protein U0893_12035 [Chloroflexota bacterium]
MAAGAPGHALLAVAAGVVALAEPSLHSYAAVGVTAVVKAAGVPLVLGYAMRRVDHGGGAEVVISRKLTFVLAVALVLLAFYVARAGRQRGRRPDAARAAIRHLADPARAADDEHRAEGAGPGRRSW